MESTVGDRVDLSLDSSTWHCRQPVSWHAVGLSKIVKLNGHSVGIEDLVESL